MSKKLSKKSRKSSHRASKSTLHQDVPHVLAYVLILGLALIIFKLVMYKFSSVGY